jgi:hypothetical protein
MTPRQKRRFLKQFQAQVEAERNGAPIPGDVLERMTKPKQPEPLHQVMVTVKDSRRMLPVGPMMLRPYADELAATINRFVIDGHERMWSSAAVVPMTPITAGEH